MLRHGHDSSNHLEHGRWLWLKPEVSDPSDKGRPLARRCMGIAGHGLPSLPLLRPLAEPGLYCPGTLSILLVIT